MFAIASWAVVVLLLVRHHRMGQAAAVLLAEADGRGVGFRATLDRVRSARQRLHELVADRPGLSLVGRHRHPAGVADGQLPVAACLRQSDRGADALHAHHRFRPRLHRPLRHGGRDEGRLPLLRHVLLPAGRGGGRGRPRGPVAARNGDDARREEAAITLADVPRRRSFGFSARFAFSTISAGPT